MKTAADLQPETWKRLLGCRERVPHALLLHGLEGIGKLALAERFAQLLLCEAPKRSDAPCGVCDGCRWFLGANHPDVRLVEPETVAFEALRSQESQPSAFLSLSREAARTRFEEDKKRTKPSAEIRVEQVDELLEFINIGSHRSKSRIAILHPADTMNLYVANALLKSLEEPPPGALFLLVSNRPARLLPTVRSRCVQIAVPLPQAAAAKAWLEDQGAQASAKWLAFAGGAPRKALEDGAGARGASIEETLNGLSSGDLARLPPPRDREGLELLAEVLQKRAYDGVFAAFGLPAKYGTLEGAKSGAAQGWIAYARKLGHDRALARHPLNPMLHASQMLSGWPRT